MNLPSTRYYGSKRKLVGNIWNALESKHVEFDSVLDLFGGTGILSYYMASKNKNVIYNDIMRFNCAIANALLCTPRGSLSTDIAENLLIKREDFDYHYYVKEFYNGIYYTPSENESIDVVTQNISLLPEELRNCAYYVLFQSCLIKRPFNLFHRRNLNLRENYVESRFGNKKTWEKPFGLLFSRFTSELNQFQFAHVPNALIMNESALNLDAHADLVYIDTPYFSQKGTPVSYHDRYHFLEGLMNYDQIPNHINYDRVNLELDFGVCREFEDRASYIQNLHQLLDNHHNSIIALSYTSNGYPSPEELANIIGQHKEHVEIIDLGEHSFALNRSNKGRREVLILGM